MVFTLIFFFSLLVVAFAIPPIIKISIEKGLFDEPTESRKVHSRIVPNFGGIAIFFGFLLSCSLFIPSRFLPEAHLLMAAGLILFMVGLKDDIVGLSPFKKFLAQFASAFIVSIWANIRISDLNGILGYEEIPYWASILLTSLFMVGVVNAFNLIDGVDGLAATLGVIFSLMYACLFFKAGEIGWAYLSISLAGGLIGFLFFNLTPARIFMGDLGSLLIGFIAAITSVKFLAVSNEHEIMIGPLQITSSAGLVLAILIIPIFDTMRVFTLRVISNTSPFTADRNHVHHRLLFLGLTHVQTTLVLALVNIMFIALALSLQQLGNTATIGLLMFTILTINGAMSIYIERYKKVLINNVNFSGRTSFEKHKIHNQPPHTRFGDTILENIVKN
ncbi:MraY family glycosyltransferase [Pedobacter sp.]|uniref:MraY family glycosyltransferase n=1 Tax=Pedobacter sp. TaxID=1411316 RepID=UPI003D7F9A0D